MRRTPVKEITLIDADRVEPNNLGVGEMEGVDLDDLRRTKVAAVADHLRQQWPPGRSTVEAVPESVLSLSALVAIKRADWVFCCVDHAAARLATALLAALYLKPMTDIGAGIYQQGAHSASWAPACGSRPMATDLNLAGGGTHAPLQSDQTSADQTIPMQCPLTE